MNFPKRHLADGTATTRRVVGLERNNDQKGRVAYRVLTAWAGDPTPSDQGWRAIVGTDGSVTLQGLPERETPQVRAGIVRRVRAAEIAALRAVIETRAEQWRERAERCRANQDDYSEGYADALSDAAKDIRFDLRDRPA